MIGYCPNCEKETELQLVRKRECIDVRGESIEVDAEYMHCIGCGTDFENTQGPDALEAAYREYRTKRCMLQPEEIRAWRKQYGLTQKELAKILGWGDVTLSRYENGALQDEAHDKVLRLVMEPHNLLKLIDDTPDVLSDSKRRLITGELIIEEEQAHSFEQLFEERFGRYAPSEFSGYCALNVQKLFGMILYFCEGGQLKTILNKLLFYADFKHFRDYTVSISGANYARLPFGPVPDNYDRYFAELVDERQLTIEPVPMGPYVGENCIARSAHNVDLFDDAERQTLAEIKEFFKGFSAKDITEYSHNEAGYTQTAPAESISYLFAEHLQVK